MKTITLIIKDKSDVESLCKKILKTYSNYICSHSIIDLVETPNGLLPKYPFVTDQYSDGGINDEKS